MNASEKLTYPMLPTSLRIVIKQPWFNEIAAGTKKTEYRDEKPFWHARLFNKDGSRKEYNFIEFINGYNPDSKRMITEYKGFSIRNGKYHIKIGRILKSPFVPGI